MTRGTTGALFLSAATPTRRVLAPGVEQSRAIPASLLIRAGVRRGNRVPLRPLTTLGAADFNDLILSDPGVSAAHAVIQFRDGVWVTSDLGSSGGTFVDGERIEAEVALAPGSSIRVGQVELLFDPCDGLPADPAVAALASLPQRVEVADLLEPEPAEVVRKVLALEPSRPDPSSVSRWLITAAAVATAFAAGILLMSLR